MIRFVYLFLFAFLFGLFSIVEMSAQAEESPIAEDINAGEKKQVVADPVVTENDEFYNHLRDYSIFYEIKDIEKAMWIVNSVREGNRLTEEEILGQEAADKLKQRTKSSISFYLNSIAFLSDGKYIVWLNNQKIFLNKPGAEVTLENITTKKAEFRWKTGYTKFVNSVRSYIDTSNKDSRIQASIKDGIASVYFTLEPNQSFVIADEVKIIEGKE